MLVTVFSEDGESSPTVRKHLEPKVVSAENLSAYSIHDVILPIPGFDIIYPRNDVSQWYDEILLTHGMNKDSFKHKVRLIWSVIITYTTFISNALILTGKREIWCAIINLPRGVDT